MKKYLILCLFPMVFSFWSCSSNCERDVDCPSSSYCGVQGKCQSSCTSSSDCHMGQVCSSGGRCVQGDVLGDAAVVEYRTSEVSPEKQADGSGESLCEDGKTQPCYEGPSGTGSQGACRSGEKTCTQGKWGACLQQVLPSKEVCDGKDNDCDGSIDEDCPTVCEVTLTRSKLAFGTLMVEGTKNMTFELKNEGESPCIIRSLAIKDKKPTKEHGRFQLLTNQTGSITLASNSSLQVTVGFSPLAQGSFQSSVQIHMAGGQEPLVVSLEGTAKEGCLLVTRRKIDFGSVKQGCSSKKETVSIEPTFLAGCPSFISISGAAFAKGTSSSFQLVSNTSFPLGIQRKGIELELAFRPTKLGSKNDVLTLKHNIPGFEEIRIPLVGEGVASEQQKDVFTQTIAKPDILFVVDDSAGMKAYRSTLAANFPAFMAAINQANVDYQVAVTTTSVSGRSRVPGCFLGTTKIIKPTINDPAGTFEKNMDAVGTNGDGREQALEAAYQALRPGILNDSACNQGFLRKGAHLSLIFVSDEDDGSSKSVDFFVKFFQALRSKHNMYKLTASYIGKKSSPRFLYFTQRFDGIQGNILQQDWSQTSKDLSKKMVSIPDTFYLSRAADEKTLVVKVNGKAVSRNISNGWSHESITNSIVFSGGAIPAAGDSITVEYKTRCNP